MKNQWLVSAAPPFPCIFYGIAQFFFHDGFQQVINPFESGSLNRVFIESGSEDDLRQNRCLVENGKKVLPGFKSNNQNTLNP